jgi:hypothetical protein
MGFKNYIAVVALLFTLGGVVATSQSTNTVEGNTFRVVSDCAGALQEIDVTTSAYTVISPGGVSWSSLGFPLSTVDMVNDVNGTYGAATRSCTITYGRGAVDADEIVYSCFDNGSYACSILINQR